MFVLWLFIAGPFILHLVAFTVFVISISTCCLPPSPSPFQCTKWYLGSMKSAHKRAVSASLPLSKCAATLSRIIIAADIPYYILQFIWTGLNVHYTCTAHRWLELWASMPRDLNNVTASKVHFIRYEFRILCNRESEREEKMICNTTNSSQQQTVWARIHSKDLRTYFKCSHTLTHTHYTPIQCGRCGEKKTHRETIAFDVNALIDLLREDHW